MSEVLLLVIGALTTGIIQTILARFDRRREAEATLTAIATEVSAICRLIRIQGYQETFAEMVSQIDNGIWDGETAVIEVRQNYFAVFESLAGKLGLLRPKDIQQVVHFYAYCRSVIDSTRPDGLMAGDVSAEVRIAQIRHLDLILKAILALGDDIALKPKNHEIICSPLLSQSENNA